MKFSKALIMGVCMSVAAAAGSGAACAAAEKPATIKVISSKAPSQILSELFAQYEKKTGTKVVLEAMGAKPAAQKVEAGEAYDVAVLASKAIDKLVDSGKITKGGKKDLVKSGTAVAVRKGAKTPDIKTEAALKKAVLDAKTVGYSTSASGEYIAGLFKRWGIWDEIKGRIVQPAPGVPVGSLVAKGEVEIGFQQLSELMHLEGITLLGPLPPEIQSMTVFSAGITTVSKQQAAAKKLLEFLASPETAKVKTKNGMDPF